MLYESNIEATFLTHSEVQCILNSKNKLIIHGWIKNPDLLKIWDRGDGESMCFTDIPSEFIVGFSDYKTEKKFKVLRRSIVDALARWPEKVKVGQEARFQDLPSMVCPVDYLI